ncbi:hypothetical protein PCANC_21262 [Puccinia coronata f. sp. avenae]|uniref:Uncharacterized protein n=1 Tax=Puccinia coronata f. sp. avenae TaxID=200324 RepID=A0A2N5S8K2_9BASI|nr:hypothetical protein PCANC_21262 [Puccinia coronata f. sp. avenae]PLW33727.1 hypothetical protein PCASD_12498 [Puccinia coronata f. sp. avenae]
MCPVTAAGDTRAAAEECDMHVLLIYTAGRFRKFGIHPLGVPATQGSHDQFWRPRDRTEVSVIPTTPLRQGRGVAAGPIGSPKRSLRPGNSTILFMTNFVRHNRLTAADGAGSDPATLPEWCCQGRNDDRYFGAVTGAPELVVRPLSGWNAQGVYSELSESSRRVV